MTDRESKSPPSHIRTWELIAGSRQPYTLVLEDDFYFLPNFAKALDKAWDEIREQRQFPAFLQGRESVKLSAWRLGIFGAVLILMMRFRPEGLVPEERHKHELNPSEQESGVRRQESG